MQFWPAPSKGTCILLLLAKTGIGWESRNIAFAVMQLATGLETARVRRKVN